MIQTQQVANSFLTIMLVKFMLNDVPHAVGLSGNPERSSGSMTSDIIRRAGMSEFEERHFPTKGVESERKLRGPVFTKSKQVGQYEIRMTRTNGTCTVKLYEFLEGWRRKLRATWSGFSRPECDTKFVQVTEAVKQIRFEHKTRLLR